MALMSSRLLMLVNTHEIFWESPHIGKQTAHKRYRI